jgi:hypothetical protein
VIFSCFMTRLDFPVELSLEEAYKRNIDIYKDWQQEFDRLMEDSVKRAKQPARECLRADWLTIQNKWLSTTQLRI